MNLVPLTAKLTKLSPLIGSRRAGTTFDADFLPYAAQAQQEEQRKAQRIQPLQFVLDLLQRGQYLTANMADEIEESFRTGRPIGPSTLEVLKAAWEGITGSRKGDWETLLFGGKIGGTSEQAGERPGWLPEDFKEQAGKPLIKYGPEGATGLAEGALRPRKMIGLAANILLDPLTYINPFGKATKGAEFAAKSFADDYVRLTLATMTADDFARLGLKVGEAAGKNINDVEKIVKASKEGVRWIEGLYKKAYKTAIRNPESFLLKEMAPRYEKLTAPGAIELTMKPLAEGGAQKLFVGSQDLASRLGLENLAQRIQQGYKGAGTRKMGTFFGKEFGVGERYPALVRQWDMFKQNLADTKVGGALGSAWWSVMNRGPVGAIRKALGFRNPYEKMLHLKKRRLEQEMHALSEVKVRGINQALAKFDPEILTKARDARFEAETVADLLALYEKSPPPDATAETLNFIKMIRDYIADRPGVSPTVQNLLDIPEWAQKVGIKPEEVGKIREIWDTLDGELKKWWDEEEAITKALGLPWDKSERINYFPRQVGTGEYRGATIAAGGRAKGTGTEGFLKRKAMTGEQAVENNAAVFKWLYGDQLKAAWDAIPTTLGQPKIGFDEFVKNWVKEKGLTEANIDLGEAIGLRAIDHAKYMTRMNIVDQFRQFGIPIDEASQVVLQLAGPMNTWGEALQQAGLHTVSMKGLENYLFDTETAKIITEVERITASPEAMAQFRGMFGKATAWWKTWVTANPGFHWRNAISNNITGFLKFGPRWFTDHEKIMQSIALTAYALHPEKYTDILKETLNVGDGWILRMMNGKVSGSELTMKELGDRLRSTGLLSSHTQVAEEIGREARKGLTGLVGKASRSVGDVIENQAKALAFLHDYSDLMKSAGLEGGDLVGKLATHKQILEYAEDEAKKWFIDYGDVTEEERWLRQFIPFYKWTRSNLANQISGLTLYPEMYSLIPKVRGAITSDDDFDYSLLPDYMENLGYFPIGQTAEGGTVLRWANIPLEDINKLPITFGPGGGISLGEILADVASNAHPLIKTGIEMLTGKDIFRQRDIKATERAPGVLQYLSKSPKVVAFLDGMLRLAGRQNGLQIVTDRTGQHLEMDGRLVKVLENNVPVLRMLDNIIGNPEALGEAIVPQFESWIEQISGKKDTQSALNEIFNMVSRWGGLKFREIQMAEEEERKQLALLTRAEQLRAEARKKLPGYQTRSAKALQARQKRAARYF